MHILQYKRMETEMTKKRQESFFTQIFFLSLSEMSRAMAFFTKFCDIFCRRQKYYLQEQTCELQGATMQFAGARR